MVWKNPSLERPKPDELVLLLTDSGRILEGYMSSSIWRGEEKPTYAFHGRYYDFVQSVHTFCLVNCWAWAPLPENPPKKWQ